MSPPVPPTPVSVQERDLQRVRSRRLACLRALEQKVLWLAVWTIHNANHVRPNRDGLKVGGHQASSSSVATLMTALYFDILRPEDRVAVKPHASPVYHAIQYLLGRQTRDNLDRFRAYGGAQSYPSRTKDADDVDFSTGSVGLGVAMTSFASLVQTYLRSKQMMPSEVRPGRMVALAGDAEMDEGNVFEALLEGWKHDIRDVWWVIDYNRQSLDSVVTDRFFLLVDRVFRAAEWRVVTLKYGRLLERAFAGPGGDALRDWIDSSPNSLYSALAYQGGAAWRQRLIRELGDTSGIRQLLDEHDDAALHRLMTNLGGHDLESILDAFHAITDDQPTCFVAYTIKGYQLPFAAHKDNHAGLMTPDQIQLLKQRMHVRDGDEWEPFAGLDIPESEIRAFVDAVPFKHAGTRRYAAAPVAVPSRFSAPAAERMSTQEGFGRLLSDLARQHPALADHIVTTSPDVTVSTNLGGWVNRRGVFARQEQADVFRQEQIASPQQWALSPGGQHIELGIAENNLFLLLGALGLAEPLFGVRLLPIGTVYDPFICRGLDALSYACSQNARFILVATPSGLTLAPEGGAHQSIHTPLIGIGQPGLTMLEPAYVDELAELLRWSLEHVQSADGGAVYLRLSTRPVQQPKREMTDDLRGDVIAGAYWLVPPAPGATLAVVCAGAVVPEAIEAHRQIAEDAPVAGLLVVTSVDRLHSGWIRRQHDRPGSPSEHSHIERMLEPLSPGAGLVTVLDGHPATLSWLGSVRQHRTLPLGVERFGQSGDIPDLFRSYRVDADAIVDAAARLAVEHYL